MEKTPIDMEFCCAENQSLLQESAVAQRGATAQIYLFCA